MKKIIPMVVVLLIVGVVAYALMSGGQVQVQNESYTYSALKSAIAAGVPLKCEYEVGGATAEGYVKGENWRGKMTFGDGRTGEIIIKDECMYSWEEGDPQGVKMCFDSEEGSIWDQEQVDNTDVSYHCTPATVNGSMFTPPENIEFMSMDSMMNETVY